MNIVKRIGIGLLSGLIGGLMWGIGARIAMRIVALAAHKATDFSLEGSVMILMMGAIYGLPIGLIFAGARRFLPGSWRRSGLMFGLLILLLLGGPFYLGPLAGESGAGDRALAVGVFAALFIILGMTISLAYHWLDRLLETRYSGARVKALTP